MAEIIENRKRLRVPFSTTKHRLNNRQQSILPQWTELTGSPYANKRNSTRCKCGDMNTISAAEFGFMIGTIAFGTLISLFLLFLAIQVSCEI